MTPEQLLQELKENECIDLVKLYQANPSRQFYGLIEELYQLRKQHGLSTRLSPLVTEIESLTHDIQADKITPQQFTDIATTLDLNQRAHKMSRFILTLDNHQAFNRAVDIIMFGDSITEWGPWHDALGNYSIANRGLAGDTTTGMVRRLETTSVCQPKLVCIMAGINDLSQGYSVTDIIDNYSQMLDFWQAAGIEVWVQSTLYVGKRLASLNSQVTILNEALQQLCNQKAIRFIDINQSLCPQHILPLDCSCDDLHLNSHAYQQWLAILTPLLEQRFK
ncbi:SGNH/GDSL hydrolase family protein [Vibrio sinaloensis]|uniref:SGNH/GDSL hydrolase family protein n=1 Tax=Photobacterium sp. (strain ATCC 43367) TaxID=379097 RepID=UPI0022AEBDA4|nr:SGNH/GDSL hydrolase family protein [Vibrio sinaloensis]MCZ4295472.1 SGNH/GDSL hydrolase family protein [Vibrio sinaloensis]